MGKTNMKTDAANRSATARHSEKKAKTNQVIMKKGFVQVIEVAIAALLIVLALPVFFSALNAKQEWARHDLLAAGNGIIKSLEASGNISQIFNNTQDLIREIELLKPANVKYSLRAEGAPKPGISIACVSCSGAQLSYAQNIFTPAAFNGNGIDFTVTNLDLASQPSIPENFDVAVFIDYPDWTTQKQNITNYMANGGGVLAIQPATSNADFLGIFSLSSAGGSATYQNFTAYYPAGTNIGKYFQGFGFDVATPDALNENYNGGTWRIWDSVKQVNTTGAKVGIMDLGVELPEGGTFNFGGAGISPDGKTYAFKVKKIWPDKSGFVLQPLNKSFVFKDFLGAGETAVQGNNILTGNSIPTYSLAARNGSAVWISSNKTFANGEYRALAKAAAASLAENFYLMSPQNMKNSVDVSAFESFCCDAPETVKLTFSLWYAY